MTREIGRWISVLATAGFSVVAAYSRLQPKEREPLYARIAVVGAVFSFLSAVLAQSLEQAVRTDKARQAAESAAQQAAAANETLRQFRRTQTVFRTLEFGPLFRLPTDLPPLKGYVDRLFREADQTGIGELERPKAELSVAAKTPIQGIVALDVRPGSRFDPANFGFPEVGTFFHNLGVQLEVYAGSSSILDDTGHLRADRPAPSFRAWSEVTLPHAWRISRGRDGGQKQWLTSNPRSWHRSSRVDSVEDLLSTEVLISVSAADNDNLDLRDSSDRTARDLLKESTFSHMVLAVNERFLDLSRFRVASGTDQGFYFEVYRLPEREADLFTSP